MTRTNLIRIRRAHHESPMELIQVRAGVEMVDILDMGQAWNLWLDLSKCLVPSYVTSLAGEPPNTKKPVGKSMAPPTPPVTHSSANGRAVASQ